MIDTAKKHFFQKFIDDTLGYYRVYDYLKLNLKGQLNETVEINTASEFWRKIYKNDRKYRHKQIVELKDFFISEWVPKLPGRVWTEDGERSLMEGLDDVQGYYSIFDKVIKVLGPVGKMKMMMGGYGSLRLKPSINRDYCTMLNLIKVDDWHCDYGIPVVVSKAVYESFLRYRQHEGAPWVNKLKGMLYLDEDLPHIQKIPNAIGANLSAETIEILSEQPFLRKAFIYVSSPLDIDMKYNGSAPEATAWTLFKTRIENEPLRLTYARFEPFREESIFEAVGFLNQYVTNFDGTTMLTDFDGVQKRLLSTSSLSDRKTMSLGQNGTLKKIDNWINKYGAQQSI